MGGTVTNSYIYGSGGIPVEQVSSGGTVTYLHHDQQGSTRLLTGSAGTVTAKCTYGAYGAPTCEGTTTTPLGYHGLAEAIQRDAGRGVSPSAILDAVKSPVSKTLQADGATQYVGRNAVVVVSKEGRVVTTYGRNSAGLRNQP